MAITTVSFGAYAGSTKVDGHSRRALYEQVDFNFSIGDPDLPGGADRIKIQICTEGKGCSEPVHAHRDSRAERLVIE
ncbi:hypothetical protein [Kibdelosporangium aridum]|uniref:Uncharacterized protein n=1 Tax=Kibdelosporangium aridum TaxID=2030 RepID=A0A1W2FMS8_KIBAR|nr:hypothetical protein [Kibdelosporangium aridum]SMD23002.1 hypothetical protein SAMN05661093_07783 [Kibdelosporangium aridum]